MPPAGGHRREREPNAARAATWGMIVGPVADGHPADPRRMQNFLGTCLALGILAGGFTLTGDLGWLAARGMQVIQSTGVPDHGADAALPVAARPEAPAAQPAPLPPVPAAPPRRGAGPERIVVADSRPGGRILVWLDAAADPLAVDVVDPGTAAVILQRGTPRRVMIAGGVIARGTPLLVVPLGLAHAGTATSTESLGRVAGLEIDR